MDGRRNSRFRQIRRDVLALGVAAFVLATGCSGPPVVLVDGQPLQGPGCGERVEPEVIYLLYLYQDLGWLLHEAIVPPEREEALFRIAGDIDVELTTEQAVLFGARDNDDPIWVYTDDYAPLCRMDPGAHWAIESTLGESRYVIVRTLEGECPIPPEEDHAIAIRSATEPAACLFARADSVEESGERPPPEAIDDLGLPERFREAMDPAQCAEPDCRLDYAISTIRLSTGFGVHEVLVTRTHVEPGRDECTWPVEDLYGVFLSTEPGEPMQALEGALGPPAIVFDPTGARAVLAEEDGQLWLYSSPPPDGQWPSRASFTLSWYAVRERSRTRHSFGPTCR